MGDVVSAAGRCGVAVSLRIKPLDLIDRVHESYLAQPNTGEVVSSYFLGEVGILLIQFSCRLLTLTVRPLHRR